MPRHILVSTGFCLRKVEQMSAVFHLFIYIYKNSYFNIFFKTQHHVLDLSNIRFNVRSLCDMLLIIIKIIAI